MTDGGQWPRVGGGSLLLIPVGPFDGLWDDAVDRVRSAIEPMNVAVGRGIDKCDEDLRPGIEKHRWIDAADVLVFACPADFGIYEAKPLLDGFRRPREVGQFFRAVSQAALTVAKMVGWVGAHDWAAEDWVRCEHGDVDSVVQFATSPGAWLTYFVGGYDNPWLLNGSMQEFPFCYFVHGPVEPDARNPFWNLRTVLSPGHEHPWLASDPDEPHT